MIADFCCGCDDSFLLPNFAASAGVHQRFGLFPWDATQQCSGLTGSAAFAKRGLAYWVATNFGSLSNGAFSATGAGIIQTYGTLDTRAINRYMHGVGYWERTVFDTTVPSITSEQCWVRATWQFDRRCGLVNDLLIEWSGSVNASYTTSPGSTHFTVADDGTVTVTGDDPGGYNGTLNAMGSNDFTSVESGTATYAATISDGSASWNASDTAVFPGIGSAPETEILTVTLTDPFLVADVAAYADTLMAPVNTLGLNYPIYDPGTNTTTSTLFTYGCQWTTAYNESYPITITTQAHGPETFGIADVVRTEVVDGEYVSAECVSQQIWVANPAAQRVCLSSQQYSVAVPNTNPTPPPDNGALPGPTGAMSGKRYDGQATFHIPVGDLGFSFALGKLWLEGYGEPVEGNWPAVCFVPVEQSPDYVDSSATIIDQT